MLIQYYRLPTGDREHIQFSKSTLRALGEPTGPGGTKIPKFPLGEPIGCVIAVPQYEDDGVTLKGFRIGWSLFATLYERKTFTKARAREIAIKRAYKNLVTTADKGENNFPHSLTKLIEDMMIRGRLYYKTENIINYA